MSSAQREIPQVDEGGVETEAMPETFALKQQIAEKVAAHRARKGGKTGPQLASPTTSAPARARSARIAAAVAERYSHSQSYRAFLAEEAEKAIRQAEAAAEVAARNAQAVAAAQYELLAEFDQMAAETPAQELVLTAPEPPHPQEASRTVEPAPVPSVAAPGVGLRVQLYEEVALKVPQAAVVAAAPKSPEVVDETEAMALDEEIAFRQAPVFEEPIPPVEIPANLIEFPRQLVAPRRARPRLAEGPLREEAELAPDPSQLRIFEVEAFQISTAPAVESAAPEWSNILLSPQPAPTMVYETPEDVFVRAMVPQTAPVNLRLMAGIVDVCIVTAALLLSIGGFALTASHFGASGTLRMSPQAAAIAAVATLVVFGLVYQLLFFTFSDATPGMRYARIGLCTLSDENPTRAAMRRRIYMHLLSACPLGMGYLWALLDDDRLAWHDRMSRMYQRSY